MLKIEVTTTDLRPKDFTGKDGKQYHFKEQGAYLHRPGDKYPESLTLTLPKGQTTPYAVGYYTLSDDSFWVNRYGQIECSPVLVPMVAEPVRSVKS